GRLARARGRGRAGRGRRRASPCPRLRRRSRDARSHASRARGRGSAMSSAVEAAVTAIRAGGVVVIPTDTVYGLAATADRPGGRDALYARKGRPTTQPTALVAATVDALLGLVPELETNATRIRALLPGPYTLVVANPAHRFEWLCGENPAAIGVRVPDLA